MLPFGLSSVCYLKLFTKLLRLLIRLLRGRGLKAIVYLDDDIVAIRGKERAIRENTLVKSDLESAGFVVNLENGTLPMTLNGLGSLLTCLQASSQ